MVIEELLSENNITLSNLNGYIGEIKPQINKKEELENNNTKKHRNTDKNNSAKLYKSENIRFSSYPRERIP